MKSRKTITHIFPWRSSRIIAVVCGITGILVVLLMFVLSQFGTQPWNRPPPVMFITVPLLIGFMSFLISFCTCAIYNVAAKVLGGIEYVSEEFQAKSEDTSSLTKHG